MAPPEEQEVYVSATLVVAPAGSGQGQVGFSQLHPNVIASKAQIFTVDNLGDIYILDVVNHRVVEFDSNGNFVINIPYGDAVAGPRGLAVDNQGRPIICGARQVSLFDRQGQLVREFPAPSWLWDEDLRGRIRVDEQGTIWVEARANFPNAPNIEGEAYYVGAVPLGNASQTLTEEQQKANAITGLMRNTGTYYSQVSNSYPQVLTFYDNQGIPIYSCPGCSGHIEADLVNNLYLVLPLAEDQHRYTVKKCNPQGKVVVSFDVPIASWFVTPNGAFYSLKWDPQASTYSVIRWQQQ